MNSAVAATERDIKVISLIGVGHFLSHVYQLALPAVFPIIHQVEGFGYAELGVLASLFFITSALCQPVAGFLVDRVGARPVLTAGLTLIAGATALYSITHSYAALAVLSVAAGLGNSVFHPADFSILNGSVSNARIGRGLSVHGFGGFLGYAVTPFSMFTLGTLIGWRGALLAAGSAGLIVTAILWTLRADLRDSVVDRGIKPQSFSKDLGVLFRPSAVLAFSFFAFMAMGSIGLMTFGASTLIALLGISAERASMIISMQLSGSLLGILIGGVLADRYSRPDRMTAVVVTAGVAFLMLVPLLQPKSDLILMPLFVSFGLLYGIAGPLRDMVVRSIAPTGSAGKVFGFTYSGMDFGSAAAAFLFGYLLSESLPIMVFISIGTFILLGVCTILFTETAQRKSAMPLAA